MSAPLVLFTTANFFIDPGPWGEETGWRGFALPRLLTLLPPLPAAIILGLIWGVWHTPAFFASGLTQFGYNFAWFFISTTCLTILMTCIYVNANRNYFVAGIVPHAVNNLMFASHVVGDIRVQMFVLIAIAVVIVAMFGPGLRGWRRAGSSPSSA